LNSVALPGCLFALLILTVPTQAYGQVDGVRALPARGDGVYGRFDGDMDFGLGLGVRAGTEAVGPTARLSVHFLQSLGLVGQFTWPSTHRHERWEAALGLDVRPLFLPRWALDLEQGPAFADLLLDSLSVSAGPVFTRYQSETRTGFGLDLGAALPLSSHSRGFWLHLRGGPQWWPHESGVRLSFTAALAWHAPWVSPAVSD
jgi:hypothetical protein